MFKKNQGDGESVGHHAGRRVFLRTAGGALAMLVSPVGRAAVTRIIAIRVWPSEDYTRITLEGADDLRFSHHIVKNPERLVVDLEGIEFNSIVEHLPDSISASRGSSASVG